MDFDLTPAERDFRDEVRTWLEEHLVGEFAGLRGRGGTGQEDIPVAQQIAWERELAGGGWLGIDFPSHLGGRECSLSEQVLFHQTYVEARAPGRLPNMGVTLLGPTLVAYGSPEQQQRFVPAILAADQFWCQGYSEPNAGSDLANVATKAVLDGDRWVITGQKIWTSLAQYSDWCFVVCRTDPDSVRHGGLSYLLVPMDQPGIEIRPIVQITGGTEFNEVFFDAAVTDADLVVGRPGQGWEVAMGTLAFERGASTLGQQTYFRQEFDGLLAEARAGGTAGDPVIRQELARTYAELEIMRYNNLRMLTAVDSGGVPGPEMSIGKLVWSNWHRSLGELMMRVRGAAALVAEGGEGEAGAAAAEAGEGEAGAAAAEAGEGGGEGYSLDSWQRTFLYSRAHTIYAGSNEIQRNIIGERVLGLPREPR